MDKATGSRKIFYDITYKWVPFLFVVFLLIVCTALLSTSGKPSYGVVVAFCVTAGLLVSVFLSCHLLLYCTAISHRINREIAHGDDSTSDQIAQPSTNVPPKLSANANATAQVLQQPRDQPDHQNLDRDAHHRHSHHHASHQMGRYAQSHSPTTRPDVYRLSQISDRDPDQLQAHDAAEVGARQQLPPPTIPQRPRESVLRRGSAIPEPLRVKQSVHHAGSTQQRYRPSQALGPSSHRPHSQRASDRNGAIQGAAQMTTPYMAPAELPSHEPTPSHGMTLRDAVQQQTPHRGSPGNQLPGNIGGAFVPLDEMFFTAPTAGRRGLSAQDHTPRDQVEPQQPPAEGANSVQAQFAFIRGPDVLDLISSVLSVMKPRTRLPGMPADDLLDKHLSKPGEATAVNLQNADKRSVQVHRVPPAVARVRSQKARVQGMPLRDSSDSGYCTADSDHHATSPQLRDPSTAVPSQASASSQPSRGSSALSSPSAGSERYSSRPSSVSSMGSEWMGWYERAGIGDESAIGIITGRTLRGGRLRARRRSKTC
ncbi:hypothetical protein Daus18300_000921 [Diaporthe australafricana]|uniref:Uncharacterized protein n=1 Tax=Diaporthe australafricana TaxID=127596 RepID=A0ABR3Y0P7_9PEZI